MYRGEFKSGNTERRSKTLRGVAASVSVGLAVLSLQHRSVTVVAEPASVRTTDLAESNSVIPNDETTSTVQAEIVPDVTTSPQDFIRWAASKYHTPPERALCIAKRESNYQAHATNTWDSNAQKGVPSRGMFQFVQPTAEYVANHSVNVDAWRELGMTYSPNGIEVTNSALIKANWTDPGVQTLLFLEAQEQGLSSHWSTHNPATEC